MRLLLAFLYLSLFFVSPPEEESITSLIQGGLL